MTAATICPHCNSPESICYIVSYVPGEEKITPFQCLSRGCNKSVTYAAPYASLVGTAACVTPHCAGAVSDEYGYDQRGRLSRLLRRNCRMCGTDRCAEVSHAGNAK